MFGQVLRFGGVGGLATLAHVLTALAVKAALPVSAQQANLVGYVAGFVVSYTGHARVTFGAPLRSAPQLLRFFALSLAGLAASSLTVHVVATLLGLDFVAAMAVVAVIVPAVTYLAMRYWVFAGQRDETSLPLAEIALCAAMVLAMLAVFWDRLANHDIAWYLFATRDWLAGAELYTDLMEVNPPLAFYLTVPALMIADLLGISDANGHYVAVALLLFAVLLWAGAILRSYFDLPPGKRALFLVGTTLAVLLPTLNGLGQREQMLVLCFLPWALREAAPRRATVGEEVTSSFFAAVGMCLKPHFVLLPLAVTVLNCIERRSLRPVLSAANLVFLAVGLAYVAFVWTVHPAFLLDVVPTAVAVYSAYGQPFVTVLLQIGYAVVPMALLVAVLWRSGGLTREVRLFLALALGGLASFLLQGTGFAYHKLPLAAFSAVACLFLLLRAQQFQRGQLLAVVALALIAVDGLRQGFYQNTAASATAEVIAGHGKVTGMIALSSHVYAGPPIAMALGADWASSYPANWLVPGAMNRLAKTDCAAEPDTCALLRGIAARNRSANIADMARLKPDLLIVDRNSGYFAEPGFNWLAFMAEDPAWAAIFADYQQIASNSRILYFLRNP